MKDEMLANCVRLWGMKAYEHAFLEGDILFIAENAGLQLARYEGALRGTRLRVFMSQFYRKNLGGKLILLHVDEGNGVLSLYLPSLWQGELLALEHVHLNELGERFWALWRGDGDVFLRDFERYFGRAPLERKFVASFRRWVKDLESAWEGIQGEDADCRRSLALDVLLRLLFLAFLGERSVLDGRENFMMQEAASVYVQGKNVYNEFIKPLFFETLNTAVAQRNGIALSFGSIPFLNGGLFKPSAEEIENPCLTVSNAVIMQILEEMMSKYKYTEEDNLSELQKLDPMMLGHVFESLMCENLREKTGSYYTPQAIVMKLSKDALHEHLNNKFNLQRKHFDDLLNGDAQGIDSDKALAIDEFLRDIKILDPSSGSGSFLAAAYDCIYRIRVSLQTRLPSPWPAMQISRHILSANLYGVDLLPEAVKISELRLWLASLRGYVQGTALQPLPNLDLNIRCGNSLIEISNVSLPCTMGAEFKAELAALKTEYMTATGAYKQSLIHKIHAYTQEFMQEQLSAVVMRLKQKILELQKSQNTSLFPDGIQESKSVYLAKLQRECERYSEDLQALQKGQVACFSFSTHFPEVIDSGGFDMILGNPPWKSVHTLSALEQEQISLFYRSTRKSPKTRGIRQSMELAAVFFEKSLRLLKRDGVMALVLPHKLFNAPSYAAFRDMVMRECDTVMRYNWTREGKLLFNAANYPAALLLTHRRNKMPLAAAVNSASAWVDSPKSDCQRKMESIRHHIGDRFLIRRGLFTGKNDVFIPKTVEYERAGVATLRMREGEIVQIESQLLHPILRGADIAAYSVNAQQQIIFTHHKEQPQVTLKQLPKRARAYFAGHAKALRARSGYKPHAPVHKLFRTYPEMLQARVVWRDLSEHLEACFVDEGGALPLNTVYYIPVNSAEMGCLLCAYLNSAPVREFCRARAEHALGGYRRYFAWLIASLPWPFPSVRDAQIIKLSRILHDDPQNTAAQTQINALVSQTIMQCSLGKGQHSLIAGF